MDDLVTVPVPEAEPDLGKLERIEAELFAVERALVQIDEGVYEGFEGLPEPGAPSVSA